jgi:predicted transcriptional regulator
LPGHGDWRVERSKRNCGRISVFKGREAKLNYAVFHILALKGPQTIYDIHKELKAQKGLRYIRYATVNKRIRLLKESGYINKIGEKKTKAGFQASVYELTARAYLAILLNSINLDKLVKRVDEATASMILAAITYTI